MRWVESCLRYWTNGSKGPLRTSQLSGSHTSLPTSVAMTFKCILVPKLAPDKCLHLDCGRTADGTKIHLWGTLPTTNPDYLNQVWIVDGQLIRSAKATMQVIQMESKGTALTISKESWYSPCQKWFLDEDKIISKENPSFGFNLWGDKIVNGTLAQLHPNCHGFHILVLDGMGPGASHNFLQGVESAPSIDHVDAGLSLLFASDGTGQSGSCGTELSVKQGYETDITINNKLHDALCKEFKKKGSALGESWGASVAPTMASFSDRLWLDIPRFNSDPKTLQLSVNLGFPCFVYQIRYTATLKDGTIVEYYGGHFITGRAPWSDRGQLEGSDDNASLPSMTMIEKVDVSDSSEWGNGTHA